jgi:uncharacterized protein DUF4328
MPGTCPRCGSAVAMDAAECPQCGLSLADPSSPQDRPLAPPVPGQPLPPPLPGSPAQGWMPAAAAAGPPQLPSRQAATAVRYLLGLTAIGAVYSVYANLNEISVIQKIRRAFVATDINAIRSIQSQAEAADSRQGSANTIVLAAFIVTGIIWLILQYRAQRSLRSLATPGSIKFKESDAVVWWLIPVANFWMPLRVNRELHSESSKLAGAADDGVQKVNLWWTLYLASAALGVVAAVMSGGADDPSTQITEGYFSKLITSHWFSAAGRVLTVMAAVAAIGLIGRATANLEAAHRRATSPASPTA